MNVPSAELFLMNYDWRYLQLAVSRQVVSHNCTLVNSADCECTGPLRGWRGGVLYRCQTSPPPWDWSPPWRRRTWWTDCKVWSCCQQPRPPGREGSPSSEPPAATQNMSAQLRSPPEEIRRGPCWHLLIHLGALEPALMIFKSVFSSDSSALSEREEIDL